jgi:tetratricopeptide (TPR) repeat protein
VGRLFYLKPLYRGACLDDQLRRLLAMMESRDFLNAARFAEALVRKQSGSSVLLVLAGICFSETGKLARARTLFETAFLLDPGSENVVINFAAFLLKNQENTEAVKYLRGGLVEHPRSYRLLSLLGQAYSNMRSWSEALRAFRSAYDINPDDPELLHNLGLTVFRIGHADESIHYFKRAISLRPNYQNAYNSLGIALDATGRVDEAISVYKKAISINPSLPITYNNLGNSYLSLGEIELARESYRQAIRIDDSYCEAYRHLVNLESFKDSEPPYLKRLIGLLDRPDGLSLDQMSHLNFAVAKIFHDQQRYDEAFTHFAQGNELRKKYLAYDIGQDMQLFTDLSRSSTAIPCLDKNLKTDNGTLPIFVVGMPRSGTSLVEQILSAHPEITAGGELDLVSRHGKSIATGTAPATLDSVHEFRAAYLKDLNKISNRGSYVTDKMPLNFRYLALINAAFPDAKVIHLRRDFRAVCWSNFRIYFPAEGMAFTNDMSDLMQYYDLYTDLMSFFRAELPIDPYELSYESLTNELESEVRAMLEFLALDWAPSCLAPEKNRAKMKTASSTQIRQPVYRGSSEEWQKYETQLVPFFRLSRQAK